MSRGVRRACAISSIGSFVLVTTMLVPATGAFASSGRCGVAWSLGQVVNPGAQATLTGLSATSPSDRWVVGRQFDSDGVATPLAEHYDGTSWSVVPLPDLPSSAGLQAVSSVTPADVWAVGNASTDGTSGPFSAHWNGTQWEPVSSPAVPDGVLFSVSAAATDDVWAVGWRPASIQTPIAEHFDGTSWTVVPTPTVPGAASARLQQVQAFGPDDAWAVGLWDQTSPVNTNRTLVEHWDGTAWTIVNSPNVGPSSQDSLNGISGSGPADIWAVGQYRLDSGTSRPLTEHWDGSSWSIVPSPKVAWGTLLAATMPYAGDAWAVGAVQDPNGGFYTPLVEHWSNGSWRTVSVPHPTVSDVLGTAASDASGYVWSAGTSQVPSSEETLVQPLLERFCYVQATDSGLSTNGATVDLGGSISWSFPPSNDSAHSINDTSGVIGSGAKVPGSSFSFAFFAAGTYRIGEDSASPTFTTKTSMKASPGSGSTGTVFALTWATATAPLGFTYDVQIKRPGTGRFAFLTTGRQGKANFLPDAGAGSYSFRARIRKVANGTASGWSPHMTISVSA